MAAYLTIQELKTHLRDEELDTITRGDMTIAESAIDSAIEEARGYLSRFNTHKIFTSTGSARNYLLLIFVKDIAVWHVVNICNAGTDLELREKRYNRAVDWLKGVQRRDITPNLPEPDADPGGGDKNNPLGEIAFGSNPKRVQHY